MKSPARAPSGSRAHQGLFLRVFGANALVLVLGMGVTAQLGSGIPGAEASPAAGWAWAVAAVMLLAGAGTVNWLILSRAFVPIEELRRIVAAVEAGQRPPDSHTADEGRGDLERSVRGAGRLLEHCQREWEGVEEAVDRCRMTHHQEASRLAGELYDQTAQQLAAVLLRTAVVRKQLEGRSQDDLARDVDEISEELAQGVEDVRRAAHVLRSSASDRSNPVAVLAEHLKESRRRAGTGGHEPTEGVDQ